jgi:hypothetical protein
MDGRSMDGGSMVGELHVGRITWWQNCRRGEFEYSVSFSMRHRQRGFVAASWMLQLPGEPGSGDVDLHLTWAKLTTAVVDAGCMCADAHVDRACLTAACCWRRMCRTAGAAAGYPSSTPNCDVRSLLSIPATRSPVSCHLSVVMAGRRRRRSRGRRRSP